MSPFNAARQILKPTSSCQPPTHVVEDSITPDSFHNPPSNTRNLSSYVPDKSLS
eukprot:c41942_g1_i1 orf=3-161(-)